MIVAQSVGWLPRSVRVRRCYHWAVPTSTPPADPDSLAVLHALSREDLSPEDAYNALEGIRNMAAANLIARFESKLDAQNAKLDAQDSKLKMLMWMIGAAVAVIGTLIRLWG